MRDAEYLMSDPALVPLSPEDPDRWPFPLANDPASWVEISSEQFNHFLCVLPPRSYFDGGYVVGEPSTTDHRYVTVYTLCLKVGGRYWMRDCPEDKVAVAASGLRAALASAEGGHL